MRHFRLGCFLLALWILPLSLRGDNFVFVFQSSATTVSIYNADTLEPRGIPSVTKPFALPEVRLAVERALRAG